MRQPIGEVRLILKEKTFFEFKNSADGSDTAELFVYDKIIPYESAWFDLPNPQSFMAQLLALGDVSKITVRINSPGGDMLAAQAIYTQLKNHAAEITTYIDGIAASAASLIAMAGDICIMPLNAMMMIHNPLGAVFGDHRDMDHASEILASARETMIAVYQAKTGLSKTELIAMLDHETWMTAPVACDKGFCDQIDYFVAVAACVRGEKMVVNGRSFNLNSFDTIPAAFLAAGKEVKILSDNTDIPAAEVVEDGAAEEVVDTPAAAEVVESETAAEPDPILDAVNADRGRIRAILALSRPGAESIINDAIDSGITAEATALAILQSPDVNNAAMMIAKRADAPILGIDADIGAPKSRRVGMLVNAYRRLHGTVNAN